MTTIREPAPATTDKLSGAEMANAFHPDAIVSTHAHGGPPTRRGFHVNSAPALNQAQTGQAVKFASIMRDQLQASGIPPANYIG